ncbi:MAG TPA: transposase [Burkholderiales bacterium]|nr:transposase [Burkholderiales bacterium]
MGSKGVLFGADGGAPRKRRSWSSAERQRIVEAALAPGASVAGVARANGVNANLVFKWIGRSREGWRHRRCGAGKRALRLSRADEAPSFVAVHLVEPAPQTDTAAGNGGAASRQRDPPRATWLGAIDIRLPNGAQVRIDGGADGEVLRLVLSTLKGP